MSIESSCPTCESATKNRNAGYSIIGEIKQTPTYCPDGWHDVDDTMFPIKWLADSRITFTDPGSGLTMDITIVETESDVDRCVITKAIVHSVSGPKVNNLPQGWEYE